MLKATGLSRDEALELIAEEYAAVLTRELEGYVWAKFKEYGTIGLAHWDQTEDGEADII